MTSNEKIEKALAHWTECLTDFVRWAEGAVDKQSSNGGQDHLVEEMAYALARMPKDLQSAMEVYERHLRMESAKK